VDPVGSGAGCGSNLLHIEASGSGHPEGMTQSGSALAKGGDAEGTDGGSHPGDGGTDDEGTDNEGTGWSKVRGHPESCR